MGQIVEFKRPMRALPPHDPNAPRLPIEQPTAKQFQLSDDGEGLPFPYDPRNLEEDR